MLIYIVLLQLDIGFLLEYFFYSYDHLILLQCIYIYIYIFLGFTLLFQLTMVNFASEWEKTLQIIGIVGLGQVLILFSIWMFISISFPNKVGKIANMLKILIKMSLCGFACFCVSLCMPISMDKEFIYISTFYNLKTLLNLLLFT